MTEIMKRIMVEAKEIEQECALRTKDHYFAAGRWDRVNLMLGIPATTIAAVTSVAALSDLAGPNKDIVSGVLAIIVAALTAITTFLNPNEKATDHKAASSSYDALRIKVSFLKDIELSTDYPSLDEPTKEVIKQLKELNNQLIDLGQHSPRIPRSIYKRQRKTLLSGNEVQAGS